MDIFELEEMFKSEDGVEMVIEEYAKVMKTIDEYSDLALNHRLDNPAMIDKALDILQGCYGKLNVVLGYAEEAKQFQEDNAYHNIKQECEAQGTKFVSASADREASLLVATFRRARNLFEKYVQICDKSITNLQSRSKKIDQQRHINKEGD